MLKKKLKILLKKLIKSYRVVSDAVAKFVKNNSVSKTVFIIASSLKRANLLLSEYFI